MAVAIGAVIAGGMAALSFLFALALVIATCWLGVLVAGRFVGRGELVLTIGGAVALLMAVAFTPLWRAVDGSSAADDDLSGLFAAVALAWFAFWFEVGLIGGWLWGRRHARSGSNTRSTESS